MVDPTENAWVSNNLQSGLVLGVPWVDSTTVDVVRERMKMGDDFNINIYILVDDSGQMTFFKRTLNSFNQIFPISWSGKLYKWDPNYDVKELYIDRAPLFIPPTGIHQSYPIQISHKIKYFKYFYELSVNELINNEIVTHGNIMMIVSPALGNIHQRFYYTGEKKYLMDRLIHVYVYHNKELVKSSNPYLQDLERAKEADTFFDVVDDDVLWHQEDPESEDDDFNYDPQSPASPPDSEPEYDMEVGGRMIDYTLWA